MRFHASRISVQCLFLSSIVSLTSISRASLAFEVKSEHAELFRTKLLEPPPLGVIDKGEPLEMIFKGPDQSLVKTSGGLRGWIRNQDLLAVKSSQGDNLKIGEQMVKGELNASGCILLGPDASAEVVALDRNFYPEIFESVDKEQMEMRHDEN